MKFLEITKFTVNSANIVLSYITIRQEKCKIELSYHWFLGQTTPLALLVFTGGTGSSQRQEFVPNTCKKF